ncbi:MAG: Nif3-like dinuclear metal center hexameric protein [Chromatiaceae bacterium]
MIDIAELVSYSDTVLASDAFADYCPNGLQVEGERRVARLVSGVTASQALIDAAVARGADAVLVHHGFFWKGESPCLVGMKGRRVRALLRHGVSLLAYHLPLDSHPELGNNRQLARILEIDEPSPSGLADGLVWRGRLPQPVLGPALATRIDAALGRAPTYVAGHERPVNHIAWCTGGAQGFIEQAATLGVDAYLSGEISEQTTHQARELGLHYFAAGHHATERYGVQAFGQHLADHFGIEHLFLDLDNPA